MYNVLCQREKYNYFSIASTFNFSISWRIWRINLDIFLSSFFNLIISLIIVNEKIIVRIAMSGKASTSYFFSFFCASCLNCHPKRIGKKNNMIQPITKRPTAHSKFFISHSKVNHSILMISKYPDDHGYINN